jgi:hypothetical protein
LINEIIARNVSRAYEEAVYLLKICGVEEESRNGPVLTSPDPVYLTIVNPTQRVLTDPLRDANPFFHVMEFVWMLAGENDVRWIEQFNRRFREYADKGSNTIHGAYGHRWSRHFGLNQISHIAEMLKCDRRTRRAVMGMWDPSVDFNNHNDLPCNTQIMFRWNTKHEQLDMTVINRSNDLIWGMLGANVVHMTYLFELVCFMAGLEMGNYHVFTNNLHVYKNLPKYEEIMGTIGCEDIYWDFEPYPLLKTGETYEELVEDCRNLTGFKQAPLNTDWMNDVARPIHDLWRSRHPSDLADIMAGDWRISCKEWLERRVK